jgi:hypothetical protein
MNREQFLEQYCRPRIYSAAARTVLRNTVETLIEASGH